MSLKPGMKQEWTGPNCIAKYESSGTVCTLEYMLRYLHSKKSRGQRRLFPPKVSPSRASLTALPLRISPCPEVPELSRLAGGNQRVHSIPRRIEAGRTPRKGII